MNLLHLAERIMDIIVNEIVNNDIELAEKYNKYLPQNGSTEKIGILADKRKIDLTVIRPSVPINLDLQDFKDLIDKGYYTAIEMLK